MGNSALCNPPFLCQLLNNQRDCASLKSGRAGKIRARNWLIGPNSIENQASINVARGLRVRPLRFLLPPYQKVSPFRRYCMGDELYHRQSLCQEKFLHEVSELHEDGRAT